jgi:hypothetical protein
MSSHDPATGSYPESFESNPQLNTHFLDTDFNVILSSASNCHVLFVLQFLRPKLFMHFYLRKQEVHGLLWNVCWLKCRQSLHIMMVPLTGYAERETDSNWTVTYLVILSIDYNSTGVEWLFGSWPFSVKGCSSLWNNIYGSVLNTLDFPVIFDGQFTSYTGCSAKRCP